MLVRVLIFGSSGIKEFEAVAAVRRDGGVLCPARHPKYIKKIWQSAAVTIILIL